MPDQLILTPENDLKPVVENILSNLENVVKNGFPEEVVAKNRYDYSKDKYNEAHDHLIALERVYSAAKVVRMQYASLDDKRKDLETVNYNINFSNESINDANSEITDIDISLKHLQKKTNYEILPEYISLIDQRKHHVEQINQCKVDIQSHQKELTQTTKDINQLETALITDSRILLQNALGGDINIDTKMSAGEFLDIEQTYEQAAKDQKSKVVSYQMEMNSDNIDLKTKAKNNIKAKENLLKKIKLVRKNIDADYDTLKSNLNKLKDVTTGIHKEIISDVIDVADYQSMKTEVEGIQEKLGKQIKSKQLNKPGDKHSVDIKITAGAGFGVGGAKIGATISCKVEFQIAKTADGRIVESSVKIGSIKVKGGVGIDDLPAITSKIEADINGKLKWTSSDHFENVDDYIKQKSGSIALGFLESAESLTKIKNSARKPAKKLIVLQEKVEANQRTLEKNLKITGTISENQNIKAVEKTSVNYFSRSKFDKEISVGALAAFKATDAVGVGIAGRIGYSSATSQDYKSLNFLDDIITQPALQKIHASKNPAILGFTLYGDASERKFLSGQDAVNELEALETDIKLLQQNGDPEGQLLDKRIKLKKSIGALRLEYDAFINTQNSYDSKNNAKTSDNKYEKNILNKLQSVRNVKNNAEYVKAMSLQFSMLKRLYDGTFYNNDVKSSSEFSLIEDFIEELKVPKMKFDNTDIQKEFGTKAYTPDTNINKIKGNLSVSLGFKTPIGDQKTTAGINLDVSITKLKTKKPHRPEENNIVIKFKIDSKLGLKAGSEDHQKYIAKLFEAGDIKRLFGGHLNAPNLKTDIWPAMKNIVDGEVEINFVKRKNGYALKTLKGYQVSDKRISASVDIPPGAVGIHAKVGMEIGTKHAAMETVHLGDATLMAIPFAFRAKNIRGSQESWDNYLVQSDIINKFCRRLREENKSGEDGTLMGDLKAWKAEFDTQADEADILLMDDVYKKLTAYSISDTQDNLKLMAKSLEKIIERKTKTEDQAWRDSFETTRKIDSVDIRKYVANNIVKRFKEVKKNYNISDEQAADTKALLKLAVTKHNEIVAKFKKTNPSDNAEITEQLENSKKLVKKAMSMDYDLNKLNDLTAQGTLSDQNKAIAQLNDRITKGIDNRIYVNDRTVGELNFAADYGDIQILPLVETGKEKLVLDHEINMDLTKKLGLGTYLRFSTKSLSDTDTKQDWSDQQFDLKTSEKHLKRYNSNYRKSGFRRKKPKNIADLIKKVMQKGLNKNAKGNSTLSNLFGSRSSRKVT